jgi:hypothetical protein
MSIIWFWYIFITIMFGVCIIAYTLQDICTYIDIYINGHVSFYPNLISNNMYITVKSIHDILLNLKFNNYISLIAMISLLVLAIAKFHYNKNINNIFIWLTILILILTLAFSAYTFNDLYTHLDDYVNMYLTQNNINMKN